MEVPLGMRNRDFCIGSAGGIGHWAVPGRRVTLINQLGLFGAVLTLAYQLLNGPRGLTDYWPLLPINVAASVGYAGALLLNAHGRAELARASVFATALAHLLWLHLLFGADSGVHLFYFGIAASVPLLFDDLRPASTLGPFGLALAALLLCELAFAAEPMLDLAPGDARVLLASSMFGTAGLVLTFVYLFCGETGAVSAQRRPFRDHVVQPSTAAPLAGVGNRYTMARYLDWQWQKTGHAGDTLAVLMCEVDDFEAFGDYYGRATGARVLDRVAQVLVHAVRRPEDRVAHDAGAIFVLVLPGADASQAQRVGERARRVVEGLAIPQAPAARSRVVTISVGVCVAPVDAAMTRDELLEAAHRALDLAQRRGPNRCEFVALDPLTLALASGEQRGGDRRRSLH